MKGSDSPVNDGSEAEPNKEGGMRGGDSPEHDGSNAEPNKGGGA
jgi:hypothetical protein